MIKNLLMRYSRHRRKLLILPMLIVMLCNGCTTSGRGNFCQLYNPVIMTEAEYELTPRSVIHKVMYNNSLYKDLCWED